MPARRAHVSLRMLADHLGLSPATVSLVINRSPVADSIPKETQDRVLAAARKLNYRPNFMARSLRKQRSFTIGVTVPDVSGGYSAKIMSGIEDCLLPAGYFYLVASHNHDRERLKEYPRLLHERSVEGIIAVDTTPFVRPLGTPAVVISGTAKSTGVPTVCLDHRRAAELVLNHLFELGHRHIAFIKGQSFSSDTEARWNGIVEVARELGIAMEPSLVAQLESDSKGPDLGYQVTRKLLKNGPRFTALFAFNDTSAIGAITILRERGLRVPEDVSVVGFDDIETATFHNPPLTTVRQPLRRMGELAAQILMKRIAHNGTGEIPDVVMVEPELIVRGSTARAPR